MTAPTTEAAPQTTETAPTPAPQAVELGDGGKKALDAERSARRAAEKATADLQKQLDAINAANETALQKAERERDEAKQSAQAAVAEALRFKVAAKHGISDDDASLFLTGTDEETLTRQAARLAERSPATPSTAPGPRPDLSQGAKPGEAKGSPEQDFANFLQHQLT